MKNALINTRRASVRPWILGLVWLGAALGLAACGGGQDTDAGSMSKTAAATVATGASVTGLTKVSEVRVGRTVYDYVFKVNVSNTGPALTGAAAVLGAAGTGTTIIDGQVQIGNLPAGGGVTPSDTITLRHDRAFPFDQAALRWQVTGTPATSTPSASAVIGAAGGTVAIAGGARVTIPAGALAAPVTITVTENASPQTNLRPGEAHVGKVYSFEPHGQVFLKPVTLTLPYDPALLDPSLTEGDIAVGLRLPDGRFPMIGGNLSPDAESAAHSIDPATKTVSIQVDAFSSYGALSVNSLAQFAAQSEQVSGADVTIYRPSVGSLRSGYAKYPDKCKRIQNGVAFDDNTQVPMTDRTSKPPTAIVLHSTNNGASLNTFNNEMAWATSDCNAYFAHYYIDRNGRIYQNAADLRVAQHDGTRNSAAIGIELFNNTGEPYDGRQIAALIRLVDLLVVKHGIPLPVRSATTGTVLRTPATDAITVHKENTENTGNPKCDPIGIFRSSFELKPVGRNSGNVPVCEADTPLGQQRVPNLPGDPATPALVDAIVDALVALRDKNGAPGVINTSGGDASAAGNGGAIRFIEDASLVASLLPNGELKKHADNKLLFIAPNTTYAVAAGAHAYTDVIISGTLVVNGPATFNVTGTFYLAPTARILVNDTNLLDGGNLTVRTLGTPILLGLIDATGKHGNGISQSGGDGGQVEFRSPSFQNLLVPTLITRGGNATTSVVPFTGAGGSGGSITVQAGSANLFLGGGNGPAFGVGPAFRDGITVTTLPPFYIGAELPPPPPFNVTSGGATPVAGQRTPLRALASPQQTGFTRGLLTSGGMGAFGEPAGAGGAGGDITITGTGTLAMRDVDLITGADIETVRGGVFLQDGVQHFYYAASGSLGGKATSTAAVKDGGPGGAAGNISVQGMHLFPAPASHVFLSGINGFGQPNGQPVPRTTDIPLSSVFRIGEVREARAADGTKLYRLRVDSAGTGLAGGSGGMPGGSPFVLFPGRFGQQGGSGSLSGLPK